MSSATGVNTAGISQKVRRFLRAHPEMAVALRDADEPWAKRELEELSHQAIHTLSRNDDIEQHHIEFRDGESNSKVIYWQTTEGVAEFLDSEFDDPTLTPCGHSGIVCLTAGEEYTCSRDGCDETFGREAAKEVLDG